MTAQSRDLPGNDAVFRRSRGARRGLLQRGSTALAFAVVAVLIGLRLGTPMFVIAGVLALAAAGCGAAYALEGTFRTIVGQHGISTRGYIRRTIPWSEVAGFRVHGQESPPAASAGGADGGAPEQDALPRRPVAGAGLRGVPVWSGDPGRRTRVRFPRLSIDVVRTHGRRVRLPAPVVAGEAGDYHFTDDLRELERCREQYGLQHPAGLL